MYLDLSCPLELRAQEILRDDHNRVRAYLTLFNQANRAITRIEGDICWMEGESKEKSVCMAFTAEQPEAGARSAFTLSLCTDHMPTADHVALYFGRICFSEGEDYVGDMTRLMHIARPLPPPGQALNQLVRAAGQDARNFPVKTGKYWICVCGWPNDARAQACASCLRERDEVFKRFSREAILSPGAQPAEPALDQPAGVRENPLFEQNRAGAQREQDRANQEKAVSRALGECRRQRALLTRRTIFMLALAALLVLISLAFSYLTEKRDRALSIVPPVRIEDTAQSESTPQPT